LSPSASTATGGASAVVAIVASEAETFWTGFLRTLAARRRASS